MSGHIQVASLGGPEVLVYRNRDAETPGPGEVRLRQTAIGVNFIDVYFRSGLYRAPSLPFTPGMEGVGIVEAVGSEVTDLAVGDRVAYAGVLGAYAEHRLIAAERVVRVPERFADQTIAAALLKGLTAEYLLRRTFRVDANHTLLLHAAAGGVGLLACQWAKRLGARVIGSVGTPNKAAMARTAGADEVVNYEEAGWVERVRELTRGEGVDVVYDSVGRTTFKGSLRCLKPRGLLVSFGQSSGPVPAFEVSELLAGGSLFVTRPTLMDYTRSRADLEAAAAALFEVLDEGRSSGSAPPSAPETEPVPGHRESPRPGRPVYRTLATAAVAPKVNVTIAARYPLKDAALAHGALEGRQTTGSTLLIPG